MRWRNGLVVGFAVLAACGGVSKASPSEAMCHEFENGVTPINLVGDRDPNEFAHLVYSSITSVCPQMLDDPVISDYLVTWNTIPVTP